MLDQTRFGKSCWRTCKTLHRHHFIQRQYLTNFQRWQHSACFFVFIVVFSFKINLQKAFKFYNFSRSYQFSFFYSRNCNIYIGTFQLCFCHLRSYRTFPNQIVQAFHVKIAFDFTLIHVRRTDSLVRLLCARFCRFVLTRMYVRFSVQRLDLSRHFSNSRFAQIRRICTHIRNKTLFVELLRCRHRTIYGKTHFSTCFLL